jgi:phenylpropionate dioxygenase-like ring-hydroxylating dioxygenase large terminal subunit
MSQTADMEKQTQSLNSLVAEAVRATSKPVEQATTLPPACFTDLDFFNQEIEAIFRKEWLCVGHVSQIPNRGDYFTTQIFDEPVVVTRDRADEIHALSSVCRHRWMPVIEGAGNSGTLSCPYHHWTYGLDGQLMAAPLMEQAEGFNAKECRLPEFRSEIWQGWIFVSLDEQASPLAPRLQGLSQELAPWKIDEMEVIGPVEFESPYNWKILVDNFMEAYHHIAIHAETFEPIHPAAMTSVDAGDEPFSVIRMPTKDGSEIPGRFQPIEGLTDKQKTVFSAFNLYPNHLFATLPDYVPWYQFELKDVDHFNLKVFILLPKGVRDDPAQAEAVQAMLDGAKYIHEEDIVACEAVQKGLQSDRVAAGRLSHLEAAIWRHHNWVLQRVLENSGG